jgi:hypothetical protein
MTRPSFAPQAAPDRKLPGIGRISGSILCVKSTRDAKRWHSRRADPGQTHRNGMCCAHHRSGCHVGSQEGAERDAEGGARHIRGVVMWWKVGTPSLTTFRDRKATPSLAQLSGETCSFVCTNSFSTHILRILPSSPALARPRPSSSALARNRSRPRAAPKAFQRAHPAPWRRLVRRVCCADARPLALHPDCASLRVSAVSH